MLWISYKANTRIRHVRQSSEVNSDLTEMRIVPCYPAVAIVFVSDDFG